MPPRQPLPWKLRIRRSENQVATISVVDPNGRHVATFHGPGAEPPETAHLVGQDPLQHANAFVWGCGGVPVVEEAHVTPQS